MTNTIILVLTNIVGLATNNSFTGISTETKLYEDATGNYQIEVMYNESVAMIPATYPAGVSHYPATFTIYKLKETGKDKLAVFEGQFTHWKCFEDKPEDLVKRALESTTPKHVTLDSAPVISNNLNQFELR